MNKDIRQLKDNAKYVYGNFPLGSSKVSTSPHVDVVHDIRAAGVETFVKDGYLHFATPVNSCDLPLDESEIGELLAIGLYINDLPIACELNTSQLSDLVPESIGSSIKYDEDGNEDGQMTWQEWLDAQGNSNVPRTSNDGLKVAFRLADRGRYFDSSKWIILAQAGINFMSWESYKTLLETDNYTTEE